MHCCLLTVVRFVYCIRCCGVVLCVSCVFFFQAEDGIRDLVRSRGLGDVYKRQTPTDPGCPPFVSFVCFVVEQAVLPYPPLSVFSVSSVASFPFAPFACFVVADRFPSIACLLYTSDAADDLLCVDLGGRRIINKKIK